MQLNGEQLIVFDRFFESSGFQSRGAIITDLDGTAVHELEGRTVIHTSVEAGLKKLHTRKHPVIINTLRFPLSVIRTFGKEWYRISNAAIPVILLNGSQLGYITKVDQEFKFEQLAAITLEKEEILTTLAGVKQLVDAGINDLVLFYYPEDWTKGEIIWTPVEDRIPALQAKYLSASSVISTGLEDLQKLLLEQPLCMIFLLIEAPGDKLMAYQHTKKNNFITRKGTDKLTGTIQMASILQFSLEDSIGAGDSPMDVFLDGVGLSVHVGRMDLPFKGTSATLKLPGFHEFGDLLQRCAEREPIVG